MCSTFLSRGHVIRNKLSHFSAVLVHYCTSLKKIRVIVFAVWLQQYCNFSIIRGRVYNI